MGAAVVMRLLAKEPGGRFASVAEALAAVEGWRASLQARLTPPPSEPSSNPPPNPSPPQRYQTLNSIIPAAHEPRESTLSEGGVPPPAEVIPARIGRYQILGMLGRGGMGVVYKARDLQLERDIALKMLPQTVGENSEVRSRFLREARAAARLRHPNIVPIYDIGEENGRVFFAMQLVEGQTVKTGAPWPVMEAVGLVEKVARAVASVHQLGVIHRDLKPSNIMIDADSREPMVLDFGLARVTEDSPMDPLTTAPGLVMGTPAYMAPEQAAGDTDAIGPWTDIYALGTVLYQMLTGRLPFEGASIAAGLAKLLHQNPPRPSESRPGLDARLDAICLRALAKNPHERFASCQQFADALREFLNGREAAPTATDAPQVPSTGQSLSAFDRFTVPPATDAPQVPSTAAPVPQAVEVSGPDQTTRPGFWRRVAAWFGWRH